MVLLYVDDINVAGSSHEVIKSVKALLSKRFETKHLGADRSWLSQEIFTSRLQKT